jgi:heme-degrading monooxygenase HmoA
MLACPPSPVPADLYYHTSLFRLRPGITLDRVRAAREELSQLVETLPGVHHFTVTDNVAEMSSGYTMALFSVFESEEACRIFQRHPDYVRVWGELLEPVVAARVVAEGGGTA